MVSISGYPVNALIVQSVATFVLSAMCILVLFLSERLHDRHSWMSKWYWVMVALTVAEGLIVILHTFPLRIGEVMMLNGILLGVMITVVAYGFRKR